MNQKIKNYIKEKLNELVVLFPEMKFIISQSKYSGEYFVQVLPTDQYNSLNYIKEEAKLTYQFVELFPEEGLTFVSDESFIDPETENILIVKPELQHVGNGLKNFKDIFYLLPEEVLCYGESNYALAA